MFRKSQLLIQKSTTIKNKYLQVSFNFEREVHWNFLKFTRAVLYKFPICNNFLSNRSAKRNDNILRIRKGAPLVRNVPRQPVRGILISEGEVLSRQYNHAGVRGRINPRAGHGRQHMLSLSLIKFLQCRVPTRTRLGPSECSHRCVITLTGDRNFRPRDLEMSICSPGWYTCTWNDFYNRDKKMSSKIDVKVTYVLLEVNRRTLKQRPHEFVRVPGHGIGSVNDRFFFFFMKNIMLIHRC